MVKMRFKNQRCLGCRAKHLNPTPQVSGSTIAVSLALCPWYRRVNRPWHLVFPADIPYYFYRLLSCIPACLPGFLPALLPSIPRLFPVIPPVIPIISPFLTRSVA